MGSDAARHASAARLAPPKLDVEAMCSHLEEKMAKLREEVRLVCRAIQKSVALVERGTQIAWGG